MQLESVYSLNGQYQYSVIHYGSKTIVFQDESLDLTLNIMIPKIGCTTHYCTSRDNLYWTIIRNILDDSVCYLY